MTDGYVFYESSEVSEEEKAGKFATLMTLNHFVETAPTEASEEATMLALTNQAERGREVQRQTQLMWQNMRRSIEENESKRTKLN